MNLEACFVAAVSLLIGWALGAAWVWWRMRQERQRSTPPLSPRPVAPGAPPPIAPDLTPPTPPAPPVPPPLPASDPPEVTVREARQVVYARLETGSSCPCCGQYARMYRRPLYDKMAAWLIWCVQAYDPEEAPWLHVNEGPVLQNRKGGGDFAKLAHWGLIEEQPRSDDADHKRSSGYWRPTERGIAFAHGQIEVPSHVFLYDNRVQRQVGVDGFSPDNVSIFAALGKRFDYAELMGIGRREAADRLAQLEQGALQLGLFDLDGDRDD